MKTARRKDTSSFWGFVAPAMTVFFLCSVSAYAQTAIPFGGVPPSTSASPKAVIPLAREQMGMLDSEVSEKGQGSLSDAEDKVSSSVRDVVNHLGTTDNITVDDLNSARQAVAKIEALIDVEKHLIELEKLRAERSGIKTLMPISASALRPPQPLPSPPPSANPIPTPATFGTGFLEVSRIIGSAGHYSAIVKLSEGQTKTVQVGDHLENEGVVVAISASGIEIEHNGRHRTLHVKNVDTVFGGSVP